MVMQPRIKKDGRNFWHKRIPRGAFVTFWNSERDLCCSTVTGHSRFSLKGHVFTLKYNAYLTEKTEKPMLIINSLVLVCKRYALLHRNLIYEGYFPDWFEYFCREIFSPFCFKDIQKYGHRFYYRHQLSLFFTNFFIL